VIACGTFRRAGREFLNHIKPATAPQIFRSVNVATEVIEHFDRSDERRWVPIREGVWFRPLLFDVGSGGWSSVLRIAPGKQLACHYHTQPVYGITLEGSWRYLEHDWIANEGTFIFEPPGEMHTLVAHEMSGMMTFFVTRGSLIYTDAAGRQSGYEDVFTRLALARTHWAAQGLDPAEIDAMMR
jgi:quercetin dioxygenase-like cupin family protein